MKVWARVGGAFKNTEKYTEEFIFIVILHTYFQFYFLTKTTSKHICVHCKEHKHHRKYNKCPKSSPKSYHLKSIAINVRKIFYTFFIVFMQRGGWMGRWKWYLSIVFICISLIRSEVQDLFICLKVISISASIYCLYLFSIFFIWGWWFFLVYL